MRSRTLTTTTAAGSVGRGDPSAVRPSVCWTSSLPISSWWSRSRSRVRIPESVCGVQRNSCSGAGGGVEGWVTQESERGCAGFQVLVEGGSFFALSWG